MQVHLKSQNKQKQKKLKPLKQPVKIERPARNLGPGRSDQHIHLKTNQKQNKSKMIMSSSVPAVADQFKINNKQTICMELLQNGNVQSFIDLFYISNKCLPNVMDKKNYFGQSLHIPELNAQETDLQFLQDFSQSLVKAQLRPESLRQQKQNSMNQYNSIAFNYEDQGDFVTAAYFYQRVIDLAISCKNKQFQLIALLGLGKCFDQTSRKDQAIQLLEQAFDSSVTMENKQQRTEMTRLIGKELIQIYIKKAQECLKFDLNQALVAYESSLKIAQRANQSQSQARISHKIGQLYYDQGRFEKSIQFQVQYLDKLHEVIATQINKQIQEGIQKKDQSSLKFKEMQAHASLAKCYLKLKDIDKAQEHLNEYHKMAKQAKAQNYVADSSYYLAKLFQEKNQHDRAILFYQSYFQAAKSQKQDKKDRRLVDKARVTYAIAKANKNMEKYINTFQEQDSLKKVLDWKIKRVLK